MKVTSITYSGGNRATATMLGEGGKSLVVEISLISMVDLISAFDLEPRTLKGRLNFYKPKKAVVNG